MAKLLGGTRIYGAATIDSTLTMGAGTITNAPLVLTSGTKLTTPVAGAMEYDGKIPYITPQGTQRGLIPGMQFYRLDSSLAGSNVNTAQNILGVGVTLSSSTVYAFDAIYAAYKSVGTTAHSVGFGFGGSATINNISYFHTGDNVAGTFPAQAYGSVTHGFINTASNTLAIPSTTTASVNFFIKISGTVSINVGGTFIPQYTLSAAPGGAYTTQIGSYFLIYPIGASGVATNVGTWA